ncbi:hypothetical protein TREES_T100016015 [Tupaia chinensis]|uniref:Uncharacterized protein n=1 Tax=Tupaia chinensis TaxID=246437 RepID=L9KL24_TUPCH|nr:hypothetical protein TREES_T100016015 [Tupaia chinensis]
MGQSSFDPEEIDNSAWEGTCPTAPSPLRHNPSQGGLDNGTTATSPEGPAALPTANPSRGLRRCCLHGPRPGAQTSWPLRSSHGCWVQTGPGPRARSLSKHVGAGQARLGPVMRRHGSNRPGSPSSSPEGPGTQSCKDPDPGPSPRSR